MKITITLFFLLVFLVSDRSTYADEINTSGLFTLTGDTATATFSDGEAKSIGNFYFIIPVPSH